MSDGCSGKPQFDSWFWLRDRLTDRLRSATPVMSEDTLLPFDLPSVARKKLSVGFDGGQLSSDAGVLLLRGVEKKLGLAARLSSCIRDRGNVGGSPTPGNHTAETAMAGWGARIRTWECWKNPRCSAH